MIVILRHFQKELILFLDRTFVRIHIYYMTFWG